MEILEDEFDTNPQLVQVPMAPLTPPELPPLFQVQLSPITLGKLRSCSCCHLLPKNQTIADVNHSATTIMSISRNLT